MEQRALKKLVESISKTVKSFKKSEIECLIRLFYSFVERPSGKLVNARLDCNTFRGILHNVFGMTDDMLMNRVFFVFDKDSDNYVSVQEWVRGLSVFLRGTFEEKMKSWYIFKPQIQELRALLLVPKVLCCGKKFNKKHFFIKPLPYSGSVCFEVYYLTGDGYISREKIFDMLKNSLSQQSPEEDNDEGIRELVEISLKKMDHDNDGKISFADFEKAVRKDRLLLEVFGPCLPDAKNCLHFEALVFRNKPPASF